MCIVVLEMVGEKKQVWWKNFTPQSPKQNKNMFTECNIRTHWESTRTRKNWNLLVKYVGVHFKNFLGQENEKHFRNSGMLQAKTILSNQYYSWLHYPLWHFGTHGTILSSSKPFMFRVLAILLTLWSQFAEFPLWLTERTCLLNMIKIVCKGRAGTSATNRILSQHLRSPASLRLGLSRNVRLKPLHASLTTNR